MVCQLQRRTHPIARSAVSRKLLVTTKSSFFVTSASSRTVNTMWHPSSGVPTLPTYQTAAWSVFRNSPVWSRFSPNGCKFRENDGGDRTNSRSGKLRPRGVAVVIEAVHECMTTRCQRGNEPDAGRMPRKSGDPSGISRRNRVAAWCPPERMRLLTR